MKTVPLLALLASSVLATPTTAFADDKAECLSAASKGQVLRDAHKLVEAREQFRLCARQVCPAMVQQDCGGWLSEVDRGVSTVVFTAKDPGGTDLVNVKVSVDGQPLVTSLDGQAVAVNPGPHTFVFELANHATIERQALIKEGEKNQGVTILLPPSNPAPPPPAPPVPSEGATVVPPPPAPTSPPSGALRLWGLVIGGAGVAGIGVGIGLGLEAKSKDNTASGEPGVARQTDSQSAARLGNIATVAFGVGAAALAGGVVLWLLAPSPRAAIGMNGRDVVLGGTF